MQSDFNDHDENIIIIFKKLNKLIIIYFFLLLISTNTFNGLISTSFDRN